MGLLNQTSRMLSPPQSAGGMERGFGQPFSVALDDGGRLYVSDVVTKQVDVFDENERYLFSISDPGLARPTAVAVDSQRRKIYVLDTVNHQLGMFDLQGKLIGYLGERGREAGRFNFPTDVDVDDQGHIYVLDSLNARVQVFDEAGVFLRMFGERGTAAGSFANP